MISKKYKDSEVCKKYKDSIVCKKRVLQASKSCTPTELSKLFNIHLVYVQRILYEGVNKGVEEKEMQ